MTTETRQVDDRVGAPPDRTVRGSPRWPGSSNSRRTCTGTARCSARPFGALTPRRGFAPLDVAPALRIPGIRCALTHEDVPGRPTYGLEVPDQPVLAADRVRFHGEPVAIVAAETAGPCSPGDRGDRGRLRAARWRSPTQRTRSGPTRRRCTRRATCCGASRCATVSTPGSRVTTSHGRGHLRGRHAGPGLPRPGSGSGGTHSGRGSEGRGRHAVAACRPLADGCEPRAPRGQGASDRWRGSEAPSAAARTCRCRSTRPCSPCAPGARSR